MAKKDYTVGYKKPPKSGQFEPGQSGNPKGRPKGAKNLKTVLEEEFYEKVMLKENGKTKKIPKFQAMIKSLMAKAIKGDNKSAMTLINLALKTAATELDVNPEDAELTATDEAILAQLKASLISENNKETSDE